MLGSFLDSIDLTAPKMRARIMHMPSADPDQFSALVDPDLYDRSGKVFYSGPAAFSAPAPVYLLGLNPGGSPVQQADQTIGRNLEDWRTRPARWSDYLDESWAGMPPGEYGMAPRIRHLFEKLSLDPREVPASNVVFVRSAREADLAAEKHELLDKCWRVHSAVIEALGISTIVCLGGTAGRWVRARLDASDKVGEFVERNKRAWRSEAHLNRDGLCIVTATHPSIADWRNPASDPAPLVLEMLAR
jgi:hypothetical protein